MTIDIIFLIIGVVWLMFMTLFPKQWGVIVEKENAFAVKKGLISESTAKKFIRIEKGIGLKIILTIAMGLYLFNLWFINSKKESSTSLGEIR